MPASINPRNMIRVMLAAVITGAVAVGFWWYRWPSVTANSFARDPNSMVAAGLANLPDFGNFVEFVESENPVTIEPRSRSLADCVRGEQSFDCGDFEFTVVRGVITDGPHDRRFKMVREALR